MARKCKSAGERLAATVEAAEYLRGWEDGSRRERQTILAILRDELKHAGESQHHTLLRNLLDVFENAHESAQNQNH